MFKTAVGDIVQVPVKFTQKDGSQVRQFVFTLTAKRSNWDDYRDARDGDPMLDVIRDYLKDTVTDWSGQRFVLLENNEPAAFSPEAFDHLLKQPGLMGIVFKAVTAECAGKEKN